MTDKQRASNRMDSLDLMLGTIRNERVLEVLRSAGSETGRMKESVVVFGVY